MKPHTLALIASLALSGSAFSASPPPLPAEPGLWGAVSTMTIALTVSYTAPGTVLKDEAGKILAPANGGGPAFENQYTVITNNTAGEEIKKVETVESVSKVVTYKYGNVEFLKDQVAAETLPKKGVAPFIAGWTLVVVTDGSRTKSLYARHTDKTMVSLENTSFGVSNDTVNAEAFIQSSKDVVTTVTNPVTGLQTITRTLVDSYSSKAIGTGSIYSSSPFSVTGLYTETASKTVIKVETIAGDKIFTDVFLPGAQKLDKIIGGISLEGLAGVVEGTMSTTASVLTDLNLYMPAF